MPTSDDLRRQALDYLQSHQVLTLATTGPKGVWAAAVFYVNSELDLFFLSAGHTRHAQNMQHTPQVAGAIHEDYRDWPGIQGIQLEGEVVKLTGKAMVTAVAHYHRKFPFLANPSPQIAKALAKVNWYRLRPSRLYFIDNSKGLGHREELVL
ncbi:MAG: pyridoxamine 5'-phosphate oxidase family protein [Anaerolineae bacterium]